MAKAFVARYRVAARQALAAQPARSGRRLRPSRTARRPRAQSAEDGEAINKLQDRLYAEGKRALLVVLQGIDTAGKDGTIRHVFKQTGPLGVERHSLPQAERGGAGARFPVARPPRLPAPRLHRHLQPLALRGRAGRPRAQARAQGRNRGPLRPDQRIRENPVENGTTILKFMLHISKEEQRERLQARLDEPKSRWKFNPGRPRRPQAVGRLPGGLRTDAGTVLYAWAPWHVIPADRKWARNAAIAAIVRETLEAMDPKYPKPTWDPKDFKVV